MAKIYTKNTWVDEVLAGDERYDIKENGGAAFKANMQINLATTVSQAGTAANAAKMNNIENGVDGLDNLLNTILSVITILSDKVGVGITSPGGKLTVQSADVGSQISGGYSAPNAQILAYTNDAQGAGIGGMIGLGGRFNATTTVTSYGLVRGYKSNSTSGEAGGKLQLQTWKNNAGWNTGIAIDDLGNVGINTTTPTTLFDVSGDKIRVRSAKTPASASAAGNAGEICWDGSYIYICVATNTWKRVAIATW